MKNLRSSKLKRIARETNLVIKGLASTKHPILAHVIPMRRCNLACGYCNEYDKVSEPVQLDLMKERLDRLASFGTSVITISGGEPMLHPQIYEIISHIRSRGMMAGLISNGYYMSRDNIRKLNRAGLEYLQISIDNVKPDKVSQKSLKVIDRYLVYLSQYAKFHVNINSVIGGGVKNPEDAVVVAERAIELGFGSTLGVIHDGNGQLKALSGVEEEVYKKLRRRGKKKFGWLNQFQDNVAYGRPHCEDGLVHYCSQQRGFPGIPLEEYTIEHLEHEFYTEKPCAKFCTIACVQQVAMLDNWRAPQRAFDLSPEVLPKGADQGEVAEDVVRAES
jgi:MoaA/NifB/PqqE/SkfB family radical SAM enzyme